MWFLSYSCAAVTRFQWHNVWRSPSVMAERFVCKYVVDTSYYTSSGMGVKRVQTRKVTFSIIQGHWQWCHSTGHIRFPNSLPLHLCIYFAPFPRCYGGAKITDVKLQDLKMENTIVIIFMRLLMRLLIRPKFGRLQILFWSKERPSRVRL